MIGRNTVGIIQARCAVAKTMMDGNDPRKKDLGACLRSGVTEVQTVNTGSNVVQFLNLPIILRNGPNN
jgi:hypothetical protein